MDISTGTMIVFPLVSTTYNLGKAELCALSEVDLKDSKLVNRLRNRSSMLFGSLSHILSKQTDARKLNLSQKRKQPDSQPSQHPVKAHQPLVQDTGKGIL